MLFFFCPDKTRPIGGVKQIYRHVHWLNEAGVSARVLHTAPGFFCDWLERRPPRAFLGLSAERWMRQAAGKVAPRLRPKPDLTLRPGRALLVDDGSTHVLSDQDVIVLPEYLGSLLDGAVKELPVIVLNQNAFRTFRGWGLSKRATPNVYDQPNILGIVCVSKHNERLLARAFPRLPVVRVINGVDEKLFVPADHAAQKVTFMPRKLPNHLEHVLSVLHLRGALDGWELCPIDGMSEREVAETLRSSRVFLSTSSEEGFGLPPLEAAFSGCLVVGYTGAAGSEYFLPEYTWPVPQGDVGAFAEAAEEVLSLASDAERVRQRAAALRSRLVDNYSLEREAESTIAAYRKLLEARS